MSMIHYVRTAGLDSGLSLQESKVFIIRALELPGWGPLNEDLQLGISKVTQVPHMLHNYVSACVHMPVCMIQCTV